MTRRSGRLRHPALAAKEGENGNDDRHRPGHQGHRQAVVMPVVLGNGCLQGGIHRGQQVPQLIDETGQHRPGVGRDQFVESGRDHPPGALHHKLHQKRPGPQRQRAAGESPQRDHRQRQQSGDHNRFAPANLLRQRAEEHPADD